MSDHTPSKLILKAEAHFDRGDFVLAESIANKLLAADQSPVTKAYAKQTLAHCYANTGRLDAAVELMKDITSYAREYSDIELECQVLLNTARIEHSRSDLHAVLAVAHQAVDLAILAKSQRLHASALNTLGRAFSALSGPTVAIGYFEQALELAENAGASTILIAVLTNVGAEYGNTGNHERAMSNYTRALKLSQEQGGSRFLGNILFLVAAEHNRQANYALALEFLDRVDDFASEHSTKLLLVRSLKLRGEIFYTIGDYAAAFDYFSKGLIGAEEIGYKFEIARTSARIGALYTQLGDPVLGLEHLLRALAYNIEEKLKPRISEVSLDIANTYVHIGHYAEALSYYQQSLALSTEVDQKGDVAAAIYGIANVEHKLGNYETALSGFESALQYRTEVLKWGFGIATTMRGIGSVLIDLGRIDEGIEQLRTALDVAREKGEKKVAIEIHHSLSITYQKNGDLGLALQHLNHYYGLKEELLGEQTRQKIDVIRQQAVATSMEKERKIEKLKREQIERELSSTTMHLAMQTELLANFRNELRHIVREIDEPIETLKKIKEKLKTLPCEQIDWLKFEQQFTSVHPEFKASLIEAYPDLTKQEVKMCQLTRLGLKNIEMAQLLCLSERSIESHRYKLRKKLGIPTEQNLSEFLSAISL